MGVDGEVSYSVLVDGFEICTPAVSSTARRTPANQPHVIYTFIVIHGDVRWPIRRRFRQVLGLHTQLLQGLGRNAVEDGLPCPPPKVTIRSLWHGPHDDRFLASRAVDLQRYFNDLLAYIPYVDQCQALHEFLCSVDVNRMSYEALQDLGSAMGRAVEAPVVEASAIAALPSRDNERSAHLPIETCVICQESLEVKDDVRVLPCQHQYHFECIATWIPQSNTCCICQAVAVPLAVEQLPDTSFWPDSSFLQADDDDEREQLSNLERQTVAQEQTPGSAEMAETSPLETATVAQEDGITHHRRTAAAQFLVDQPPLTGEICKLIIRLPDGRRVERQFDADEQLAAVYAWAECCGEVTALQGGDRFEVPSRFYLSTTYPRAALRDQTRSLRELQLLPNAILNMAEERAGAGYGSESGASQVLAP